MSHEPVVTVHPPGFGPWLSPEERTAAESHKAAATRAASVEEAARETAYLQALSGMPTTPQRPPLQLRQPVLPSGFVDSLDAFDDEIFKRGIAVSPYKILALGQKRFGELLALDRAARAEQRVIGTNCDLTSWPSVCTA